jgi:dihydrofolate reductase
MQDRGKEAGMGKVIYDMSMSLDGFVTAANRTPEEPMGDGGLKLVEWGFGDDGREVVERSISEAGAVIVGRYTYDTSLPWWGPDGPTGEKRLPVFVVTHTEPEETPPGGVYAFVRDGIESAVRRAKATAGDKDVGVSGAQVGQQSIRAGLADEIQIHLVPVLFGSGTRMFEHLGDEHIQLEPIEVIETRGATHLRYRILK